MGDRKRYALVCVAPEMPSGGAFDDPDEAIVACDAYHDVYDRETGEYLSREEVYAARARLKAKSALGSVGENYPIRRDSHG